MSTEAKLEDVQKAVSEARVRLEYLDRDGSFKREAASFLDEAIPAILALMTDQDALLRERDALRAELETSRHHTDCVLAVALAKAGRP